MDFERQLRRVRRVHPGVRTEWEVEKPYVDAWLAQHERRRRPVVLDAGCGFQYGLITHFRGRLAVLGTDLDAGVLKRNRDLDLGVLADLERLPISAESVDLIFCRDVVEHVRDPAAAIGEMARSLRPEGLLVITTVNVLNPGMWAIRFVPRGFRKQVRAASFGEELGENAPTYHRCNTPHQLRKTIREAGLAIEAVELWPRFLWYFLFFPPALILLAAFNRLLEGTGLRILFGGVTVIASRNPARD